jgi:hypothetical protein
MLPRDRSCSPARLLRSAYSFLAPCAGTPLLHEPPGPRYLCPGEPSCSRKAHAPGVHVCRPGFRPPSHGCSHRQLWLDHHLGSGARLLRHAAPLSVPDQRYRADDVRRGGEDEAAAEARVKLLVGASTGLAVWDAARGTRDGPRGLGDLNRTFYPDVKALQVDEREAARVGLPFTVHASDGSAVDKLRYKIAV